MEASEGVIHGNADSLDDDALTDGGPTFIAVRIDDQPGVGSTDRDPVQIRQRFMMGLGVRKKLDA